MRACSLVASSAGKPVCPILLWSQVLASYRRPLWITRSVHQPLGSLRLFGRSQALVSRPFSVTKEVTGQSYFQPSPVIPEYPAHPVRGPYSSSSPAFSPSPPCRACRLCCTSCWSSSRSCFRKPRLGRTQRFLATCWMASTRVMFLWIIR